MGFLGTFFPNDNFPRPTRIRHHSFRRLRALLQFNPRHLFPPFDAFLMVRSGITDPSQRIRKILDRQIRQVSLHAASFDDFLSDFRIFDQEGKLVPGFEASGEDLCISIFRSARFFLLFTKLS
jgi:hypothetical protein